MAMVCGADWGFIWQAVRLELLCGAIAAHCTPKYQYHEPKLMAATFLWDECSWFVIFGHCLICYFLCWLTSYFIMVIASITDMDISMATPFELRIKDFWNCINLVLQSLTFGNVFAPGPSFRILDWTCCHWTSLCHFFLFLPSIFYMGVPW